MVTRKLLVKQKVSIKLVIPVLYLTVPVSLGAVKKVVS